MRLRSLDILRGLDLWLLLMVGPLLRVVFNVWEPQSQTFQWISSQLHHVDWEGFTLWDIIMPLFMFMSGITIPFSMRKFKDSPDRSFYLRLLKRFSLLFLCGWIVQGNILAFEIDRFHVFSNTLQAIAVGYVASALVYVHFRPRNQIIIMSGLFLAYLLAFVFTGMNLDPETNVAMMVDEAVLGRFRDGTQYTWILSSLNFAVTVMLGCFAGQIVRAGGDEATSRKAAAMALTGAGLVAAGLLMSLFFPIIKKIWSSSMTLYSGGICFLLMAAVYYLVDVKKIWKGADWLLFFGTNSIAAYMLGKAVDLSSVPESLLYGFEHLVPEMYPLVLVAGEILLLFLILRHMYHKDIFLKL